VATKFINRLHIGKELDEIVANLSRNTPDPERIHLLAAATGRRKFQDTVRNLFGVLLRKLHSVQKPTAATWFRTPVT